MGLTDQRKRAKDITDYQETSLLRLPTKRVKNYRIPTGKILTDHRHGLTLSIFVLEKRAFYIFFQGIRKYRKISKISPGAYIFQRPFLRGLFLEEPMFGGAYVWREICVIKSVGLACSGNENNLPFCFVLLCIRGQIPSTSPTGILYSEGRFNEGFFALRFWGAFIWRGLYIGGLIFGILR